MAARMGQPRRMQARKRSNLTKTDNQFADAVVRTTITVVAYVIAGFWGFMSLFSALSGHWGGTALGGIAMLAFAYIGAWQSHSVRRRN